MYAEVIINSNARALNKIFDYIVPAYMEENYSLGVDDSGNPVLYGLPFNKSTELMGYNGAFVDYCKYLCDNSLEGWTPADDLGTVPSTWAQWEEKGPKYRAILDPLCKPDSSKDSLGYAIYGKQTADGTCYDFQVKYRDNSKVIKKSDTEFIYYDEEGRNALVDLTAVEKDSSRIISWDSLDNMFITLIRQWGSEYTFLSDEQKKEDPLYRKGEIRFLSSANRQKTVDCLRYFTKMHDARIFGKPTDFDLKYNSEAFEQSKVMFMLCSSGGLSYNTANWLHRFRVAPLPYKDEDKKYVISQGADIALTDRGNNYEECFDVMVELSTGENQAEWCLQTGYYPCSNSAINTEKYQKFLHEADDSVLAERAKAIKAEHADYDDAKAAEEALKEAYSSPTRVAYREGSQLNENYYMNKDRGYKKFVDPAFKGSSTIRSLVAKVFEKAFSLDGATATDDDYLAILQSVVDSPDIKITYKNNITVVL